MYDDDDDDVCAVEITSLGEFDSGAEIVSLSYNSCYRNTTQYIILLHPNESILEKRKKTVHIRLTGSVYIYICIYITHICLRDDDGYVQLDAFEMYIIYCTYMVSCVVRCALINSSRDKSSRLYTVHTYTYNTHVRGYIIMI